MIIGQAEIAGLNYMLGFGKHKGEYLGNLLVRDPQYILWMSENNVLKIEPSIVQAAEIEVEEQDDDHFYGFMGDIH